IAVKDAFDPSFFLDDANKQIFLNLSNDLSSYADALNSMAANADRVAGTINATFEYAGGQLTSISGSTPVEGPLYYRISSVTGDQSFLSGVTNGSGQAQLSIGANTQINVQVYSPSAAAYGNVIVTTPASGKSFDLDGLMHGVGIPLIPLSILD